MSRIAIIFTSRLLGEKPNENHVNSSQDLQDRLETDPEFLLQIIMGNKIWVYRYNPDI